MASWLVLTGYCEAESTAADVYCGPRCVKFMLESAGQRISLEELIDEMQPIAQQNSVSLLEVRDALVRHGVPALGVKVTGLAQLSPLLPCIIHLKPQSEEDGDGHFVVIQDIGESICVVFDGTIGRRRFGKMYLESHISPIAITMSAPSKPQLVPFNAFLLSVLCGGVLAMAMAPLWKSYRKGRLKLSAENQDSEQIN